MNRYKNSPYTLYSLFFLILTAWSPYIFGEEQVPTASSHNDFTSDMQYEQSFEQPLQKEILNVFNPEEAPSSSHEEPLATAPNVSLTDNIEKASEAESTEPTAPQLASQTPAPLEAVALPAKPSLPEKNGPQNEPTDIYLNFENATLSSVVNYLSEQRQLNIIPHKDLANIKVSLTTRTPLTLSRAWNILLTLLEMHHFSLLDVDGVFRVVPSKQAHQEPLPVYSGATIEPEDLPDSDKIIRYIYFFKNTKADQMGSILSKILSENSVKVNKDLEACILTDSSMHIKSAMKIVKSFDIGGMRQSIKILRLKYADADHISRLLSNVIGDKKDQQNLRFFSTEEKLETAFFSHSTKIVPNISRNSLIFLGAEKHIDKLIEFIQKNYDKAPEVAQSRIHIKEIKYVPATKIKNILDSVLKPPRDQKKALIGEFKFFEDVIITAESPSKNDPRGSGNRLVVSCDRDDWKRIEEFIEKLDKPQPQIALEILIVDVTTSFIRQLGAQLRNKKGVFGNVFNAETTHLAQSTSDTPIDQINEISAASGPDLSTWVTLGNASTGNVWGAIKAAITSNNANVISQPFLIVNSGEETSISIKTTLRVAGKINDPSKAGGARTQDREDFPAKTQVKITPRMNADGIINLHISVDINEIQSTQTTLGQPQTNDRHLSTDSVMGNGQVLVLGGLTQSTVSESDTKTPILSSIPIIGSLFKAKRKTESKNDLFVFIRPSVIKPIFEGKPDDYTELKLAYAKYQILGTDTYAKAKDPIQRWFFKPQNQSIKQSLEDAAEGRHRTIDDFAQGKKIPKSVIVSRDPFYKTHEEIQAAREREKKENENRKNILSQLKKRDRV